MKNQIIAFLLSALGCFVITAVICYLIEETIWELLALLLPAFGIGAIAAHITDDRISETKYGTAITFASIVGVAAGIYFF